MAMERWIKAKLEKGDLKAASMGRAMIGAFGDEPLGSVATLKTSEAVVVSKAESIKIYPEISLGEEWERQSQNLARLFSTELDFKTPEDYIATLPRFESQPTEWERRLDTPVIVETRVSPKRQAELAGLNYFLGGLDKTDWNKRLKGYVTPEAPYTAWLDDGRNYLGKSVKDVRENLKADEIGGTEFDGIALYISNPKILEHHSLDLPGTSVGSGCAALLRLWWDEPRVYYFFVDYAAPEFGSVVRGRQK